MQDKDIEKDPYNSPEPVRLGAQLKEIWQVHAELIGQIFLYVLILWAIGAFFNSQQQQTDGAPTHCEQAIC